MFCPVEVADAGAMTKATYLFVISYDLHRANGDDYRLLADALEKGGALRVNESTWMLRESYSATSLKNYLQNFVENDALLFVARVSEADWTHVECNEDELRKMISGPQLFVRT